MDPEELKRRRLEARRLLAEGVAPAEVARRLQTSRQSVSRWARLRPPELAKVRRRGRKPGLTEPARAKLRTALLAGPKAAGFAIELWTVPRVRQLIVQCCRRQYSSVHVWRLLRQMGFPPSTSIGKASRRPPG